MPHLILEYSGNIVPDESPVSVASDLRTALAQIETFKLGDIKARCFRSPDFVVADGNSKNAFVHLKVEILAGRPLVLRKSVSSKLLAVIQQGFRAASKNYRVSYSVEVREMDPETYLKG
jgi:5-carboxymethyl-2-hydroxymuconate isomerase